MARTTFTRLTAHPGNPDLVPTAVGSAHEPGVYRVDNGRVRYALVKAPGAALVFVSEETAAREARLLLDDAAQEVDDALRAAATLPVVEENAKLAQVMPALTMPVVSASGALPAADPLALLGDALAFASCLLADGNPNPKLARGILIRDGEDFDVETEPVYVDRTPRNVEVAPFVDGDPIAPAACPFAKAFTRVDNRRPISVQGVDAHPQQNRDALALLDLASVNGRVGYRGAFSSGRFVSTGATRQQIRDGAPAWRWERDDKRVGITFELPEVTGYRAGGVIMHAHDGSTAIQVRAYVTVEGRPLFAPSPVRFKHTRFASARLQSEATDQLVNGIVRDANALARALDAAKTIDAESAAVLVATKVLAVETDKLSDTIAKLHERANDLSPSLGGIRYVLAAATLQNSSRPWAFSAWIFGVGSERASHALQVLASEAARRKADGELPLVREVARIEATLPTLEGDGGAANATRRFAILSALRAAALFPRDSASDLDAYGDRVERPHKAPPVRLLALRAVVGTMATDVRALDASWWTDTRDNSLQVMLDATLSTVGEGGAS